MKTYKLYTERYVTDMTIVEVPDDFNEKEFLKNHGGYEIVDVEGAIVHPTNYEVNSSDSEWYSLEDNDYNEIDSY